MDYFPPPDERLGNRLSRDGAPRYIGLLLLVLARVFTKRKELGRRDYHLSIRPIE